MSYAQYKEHLQKNKAVSNQSLCYHAQQHQAIVATEAKLTGVNHNGNVKVADTTTASARTITRSCKTSPTRTTIFENEIPDNIQLNFDLSQVRISTPNDVRNTRICPVRSTKDVRYTEEEDNSSKIVLAEKNSKKSNTAKFCDLIARAKDNKNLEKLLKRVKHHFKSKDSKKRNSHASASSEGSDNLAASRKLTLTERCMGNYDQLMKDLDAIPYENNSSDSSMRNSSASFPPPVVQTITNDSSASTPPTKSKRFNFSFFTNGSDLFRSKSCRVEKDEDDNDGANSFNFKSTKQLEDCLAMDLRNVGTSYDVARILSANIQRKTVVEAEGETQTQVPLFSTKNKEERDKEDFSSAMSLESDLLALTLETEPKSNAGELEQMLEDRNEFRTTKIGSQPSIRLQEKVSAGDNSRVPKSVTHKLATLDSDFLSVEKEKSDEKEIRPGKVTGKSIASRIAMLKANFKSESASKLTTPRPVPKHIPTASTSTSFKRPEVVFKQEPIDLSFFTDGERTTAEVPMEYLKKMGVFIPGLEECNPQCKSELEILKSEKEEKNHTNEQETIEVDISKTVELLEDLENLVKPKQKESSSEVDISKTVDILADLEDLIKPKTKSTAADVDISKTVELLADLENLVKPQQKKPTSERIVCRTSQRSEDLENLIQPRSRSRSRARTPSPKPGSKPRSRNVSPGSQEWLRNKTASIYSELRLRSQSPNKPPHRVADDEDGSKFPSDFAEFRNDILTNRRYHNSLINQKNIEDYQRPLKDE